MEGLTTLHQGEALCTWPGCSGIAKGGFHLSRGGETKALGLCMEHLAFVVGVLREQRTEFEAVMSEVMGGKWQQKE